MTQPTECPIPKCYNRTWAARGLPVCSDCAQMIAFVMADPDEIRERRSRIFELEMQLFSRDRTIEYLKGNPPAKRERAKVPTDGTVYYVQEGARIKIGWTSNMEKRMKTYSPDAVLLAAHPGTRKDENRIHRMFAADRTHGREWYVPTVSLTHHIERMVQQHGKPDPVKFRAQPLTVRRSSSSRPIGATSTRLAGPV